MRESVPWQSIRQPAPEGNPDESAFIAGVFAPVRSWPRSYFKHSFV